MTQGPIDDAFKAMLTKHSRRINREKGTIMELDFQPRTTLTQREYLDVQKFSIFELYDLQTMNLALRRNDEDYDELV